MRLYYHIQEEIEEPREWMALRAMIEKDCKPFLKDMKGAKSLLWRGVQHPQATKDTRKKKVRTDRKPRFIDQTLSDMMGAYSKKKWGWNFRTEGIFLSNDKLAASNFGYPMIIFPIGNYKSVWNNDVDELYTTYDSWEYEVQKRIEKESARKERSIKDIMGKLNIPDKRNVDPPERIERDVEQAMFDHWVLSELEKYETNSLDKYLKREREGSEAVVKCKEYYVIHQSWDKTLLEWYSNRYWKQKR